MKIKSRLLAGAVGLGATVSFLYQANAGTGVNFPVYVNKTTRQFSGNLASAHNSTDKEQYIGCEVSAYSTTFPSAWCVGRNSAGVTAQCTTVSDDLVDAVRSMAGDATLSVRYDSTGTCTYINVSHSSLYAPKAH